MMPSIRLEFLCNLVLLTLAIGSTVANAQELSVLQKELSERAHFLEGLLDPGITMSVAKVKCKYLLPENIGFYAVCEVNDQLAGGTWPDTITLFDKEIIRYGTSKLPNMLSEIPGMELLLFEARDAYGKRMYQYGIPAMRLDAESVHWSQKLIDPLEAEALIRRLWSLMEQKHSGEVILKDSQRRIVAEGELLNGEAVGKWAFCYFGITSTSTFLQKRKVEFASGSKKLFQNEVEARLLYDYKKTFRGYSEFIDWGMNSVVTERVGNHVSSKHYSLKDGVDVLQELSEIDLDSTGVNRLRIEQSYCNPKTGETFLLALFENGIGETFVTDSIREEFFPLPSGVSKFENSYFLMLPNPVIDTLHMNEGDTLRRVIVKEVGEHRNQGGVFIQCDTIFQQKTDKSLTAFRLLQNDTSYVFHFDLTRGYGVKGGTDLSTANALARVFAPDPHAGGPDFWPVRENFKLRIRTDSSNQWGLSSGVLMLEETLLKNGIKHGKVTKRYSTGRVALEGRYANHRPSGIWNFYEWDGSILLSLDFDKSSLEEQSETLLNAGVWTWIYQWPSHTFSH